MRRHFLSLDGLHELAQLRRRATELTNVFPLVAGYFRVYSAWNSLSLLQNGISNFGLLVCSFILANRVVSGQMDPGGASTRF